MPMLHGKIAPQLNVKFAGFVSNFRIVVEKKIHSANEMKKFMGGK
jgi:hypothetical protein